VNSALQNLKKYKPYTLNPPYKLVITLKTEDLVNEKSFYPGAKRTGDLELTYTSSDLMEVIKAFSFMH
jgi:D-amino peptidase